MHSNMDQSSGNLLVAALRALLLALVACTSARAENVCYYSASTCTGPATCVEATPNSGQCGTAAFGSYGKLNENGQGYMADIYSDRSCIKHLVFSAAVQGPLCACYAAGHGQHLCTDGTGPNSQSAGPEAVSTSSANQNRDTMAAFMYFGYTLCALVLLAPVIF